MGSQPLPRSHYRRSVVQHHTDVLLLRLRRWSTHKKVAQVCLPEVFERDVAIR